MSTVSVALAKQHMGITDAIDDELIELYVGSAEEWLENYMGRKFSSFDPLPKGLKRAVLLLTSFYYEQRDAVGFGEAMRLTPYGVTSIADAYRTGWFGEPEPQDVDDDF